MPGWVDPSRGSVHQHDPFPAVTEADVGRRWDCSCGQRWRVISRLIPADPNKRREIVFMLEAGL